MNDDTLTALDGLMDKNGRPILHPQYDASGNRLLLGYRVGICPSMPDIGVNATPIAFGATGYFARRTVQNSVGIKPNYEARAEFLEIGFQGYLRCSGALLAAAGSDSPVKYLKNAAA